MNSTEAYRILEIEPNSRICDITQAYRRLALICHPDRNGATVRNENYDFMRVNEAYKFLMDMKEVSIEARGKAVF